MWPGVSLGGAGDHPKGKVHPRPRAVRLVGEAAGSAEGMLGPQHCHKATLGRSPQPLDLLVASLGRSGADAGAGKGVPCVVSPPFTIPLMSRDCVGTGTGAQSHPGLLGEQPHEVSTTGTGSRSPSPSPAGISHLGSLAMWGEQGPGPALRVLSCREPPAAPSRLPTPFGHCWARGVIGTGTFAPGPGPGFILSADICAKQAEHAVPAALSGSRSCGARKRIPTALVSA